MKETFRSGPVIRRRHVLKTIGAGAVGGAIGTSTVAARRGGGFPPERHTKWGEAGSLNEDGEANTQTFVTTAPSGKPVFAGVYFSESELHNLAEGDDNIFTHEKELLLDFPGGTPFTFAMVDWNADGHEPPGVYDVPHFDFHFYWMKESRLEDIEGESEDHHPFPATYDLPADQMPTGYIRPPVIDTDGDTDPDAPAIVPHMGEHLVDPTSPEFQPDGEFTHTFIWGAWDPDEPQDGCGELIFQEPMITREFLLEGHEEVARAVGMPDAFPAAGLYPTEYAIRYLGDQNAYAVTLESFEPFPVSSGCG